MISTTRTLRRKALQRGGHIYYLSDIPTFGILGLIDASECPPTFGASYEDVRCYINGGWNVMKNKDGTLNNRKISLDDFSPTSSDLTIVLHCDTISPSSPLLHQIDSAKQKGCSLKVILLRSKQTDSKLPEIPIDLEVKLTNGTLLTGLPCLFESSLKCILNAITTGAHIIKGKVYKNRMIDVKVSNNKLYDRSIRIVSQFASVPESTARECLLKSIYEVDTLTDDINTAVISKHIERAFKKDKVVPCALLLATGKFDVQTATRELAKQPIVRRLIMNIIK